jgi:hypothetical protein
MDEVHVSQSAAARIPALSPAHVAIATALATPLLLASLLVLSPEFDPSYRLMSEYTLGGYGWVLSLTFLAWGVSTSALAIAVRSQIRTRGGRIGLAFLVVAGVGQALAALFDIRHDFMHNLAGAMGILGLPVGAVLVSVSLGRNPSWSSGRLLLALAHLTWIIVVVLVASFVLLVATFLEVNGSLPSQAPPALPHGVIGVVGWADRLLVVVDCAWVVALARQVIRSRPDGA